jgi:undecaprenol kinase
MTPAHKSLSFARRMSFALTGLAHAVRAERSLRTQLACLVIVAVALAYLQPPAVWWALVSLCAAGVLAAELFNTAIEHLADHVQPDLHPQIRIVKDCAAAAVLCAAAGAVAVAIALMVEVAGHWR